MSKRSWATLGITTALLVGSVSAPARAQLDKENLSWLVFASSYYMFNAHLVSGPYNVFEFPYANTQGFGLTFTGGNFAYMGEKWGIRLEMRWGQNVDDLTEFAPVSLAYATWMPHPKVDLDFGFFDAFVGVENEDEWRNPTYTRGVIYFKIQPFRHLGARAVFRPHEQVDITFIVADGSIFGTRFPDELQANVLAPALAAQIVYRPTEDIDLRLGSVTSPNGTDGNRRWQAVLDLIVDWHPGAAHLFIDGNYQLARTGGLTGLPGIEAQWGVSVGGSYRFTDHWIVGFRGEYAGDRLSDAAEPASLVTGAIGSVTVNVRYLPVEYLIITLEPRAEVSRRDSYFGRPIVTDPVTGETAPSLNQRWFFGIWLGVTAKIGNE